MQKKKKQLLQPRFNVCKLVKEEIFSLKALHPSAPIIFSKNTKKIL